MLGLSTGILPIVSFNYGSGQFDRVKKLFKNAITICTAAMVIFWILIQLLPEQIISVFGEQNELYMEFACKCLTVFMGALMTAGSSVVIGNFFQAIGKPAHATVLTLLRQIVLFVPTMLIIAAVTGDVTKVLWTGPISDGGSCIISVLVLIFSWKSIFKKDAVKA